MIENIKFQNINYGVRKWNTCIFNNSSGKYYIVVYLHGAWAQLIIKP